MIPICKECKFSILKMRYCPPHYALACMKTIKKEFCMIDGISETYPFFCDETRIKKKCGKKGKWFEKKLIKE